MAGLRGTALGSEPALRSGSLLAELQERQEDTTGEFNCEGFILSQKFWMERERERERKKAVS